MRSILIRYIIDYQFMTRNKIVLFSLFISLVISFPVKAVPDSLNLDNPDNTLSLGNPVYSQYLQNGLMINPAYTGSRGALSSFLSYRMQWMNTPGAPVIQSASLHTPLKNDKVALGLLAQFMQYGVTKTSSVYASYAYHIRLAKGKLSLGIKGGADFANSSYSDIYNALMDPSIGINDPAFVSDTKYVLPNVGAGIYYFSDKLFAGVSVPRFLSYSTTGTNSAQAYHRFSNYNFLFSAGGLITFSDAFKFKPSVLVDYSPESNSKINQLDINGNFILGDILWIGGSWRTTEKVAVGILQVQINPQLMIGFSYDYPVGRSDLGAKGSTEFILRYEFGYKVSAANPRYF